MSTDPAARALVGDLVDDAAIFPPGNAALADAVPAHARQVTSPHGVVVGPFVSSDRVLPDLSRLLEAQPPEQPLPLALVVVGGAGAIEPALTWADRDPHLELRAIETALRDEDDLAHNAARVVTVLDLALPDGVDAYVELPRLIDSEPSAGWLRAADAVAEAGHRLKFRTGGESREAHPDPAQLATVINAALDRETAFKCTAGLHHGVRHTDDDTGFEQHGFGNVILATGALLDGGDRDAATTLLADRDRDAVGAALRELDAEAATRIRGWFRSFGSCSIDEPVADLVGWGLL
ncbi:MAG: hypothetical protein ACRDPQ_03235 [Nocardioidaceae bacterium]